MRLIDRLRQHGLVERRLHPRDRRANRLYLTDRARDPGAPRPARQRGAGKVLASLSEADVAALLQKLLLIKTNIRNASGKRGATNGKLRQARVMSTGTVAQLRSSSALGLRAPRCVRR